MEQNSEVKITLTDDELKLYGDIKDQLVEEIKQELITAGFEPVPQVYDGGQDIASLVDKANQLKVAHDEEVARIKETYSEKVAAEKIKMLELDMKYEMQDLADEIDDVVAKDQTFRDMAMKELVNAEGYGAAKMECFNVLSILQNTDAGYEIVADIIEPLILAKDTRSLTIAKLLCKDAASKYLIDKTIDNINAYKVNQQLKDFGKAAKSFIVEGKDPFTLYSYMSLYSKKEGGK